MIRACQKKLGQKKTIRVVAKITMEGKFPRGKPRLRWIEYHQKGHESMPDERGIDEVKLERSLQVLLPCTRR